MYIGVDIAGPVISIGLVSEGGDLSFPSTFPVDPEMDGEAVIIDLIYSIKTIAETVPIELFNDNLEAIGVAIEGKIDEDSDIILECTNCGLERIDLKRRLQRSFEIPINVNTGDTAKELAKAEIEARPRQNPRIIAAGLICKYAPNADESF